MLISGIKRLNQESLFLRHKRMQNDLQDVIYEHGCQFYTVAPV